MTGPAAVIGRFSASALVSMAVGGGGLFAWTLMALTGPRGAFEGWWLAFLIVGAPSLGALALVLIERLTGGRWGEAFAPELAPAARLVPLIALYAVPAAFALPLVFPWAFDPDAVDPSTHALYLNNAAFLARQAVILVGWSLISLALPMIGRRRWTAGLALAFHGIAASFCAVDWVLSLHPLFTNSAQGMILATSQLAAGLGWAALQGVERPARAPAGDLGGLLFATLLGLSYLAFMSFLVGWYGDRPGPDSFWLPRTQSGWGNLAPAALVLGLLAPSACLAAHRALGMQRALAWSGGCALGGVALFTLWQTGPSFGADCLIPAAAAFVGQFGLWLGLALTLADSSTAAAEVRR